MLVADEVVEVELALLVVVLVLELVVPALLEVVDVLSVVEVPLLLVLVLDVLTLETTLPLEDKEPVSLISRELAPTMMLKEPEGMIQACVAGSQ